MNYVHALYKSSLILKRGQEGCLCVWTEQWGEDQTGLVLRSTGWSVEVGGCLDGGHQGCWLHDLDMDKFCFLVCLHGWWFDLDHDLADHISLEFAGGSVSLQDKCHFIFLCSEGSNFFLQFLVPPLPSFDLDLEGLNLVQPPLPALGSSQPVPVPPC